MGENADLNNRLRVVLIFAASLISISFVITPPARADFNPMMRVDPRIDQFTQRMNARYGLLPRGYFRQPMGTADYAAFLDSLSTLPLTPQERYTLEGIRKQLSIDKGFYGFSNESEGYGLITNLDWTGDIQARAGGGLDDRLYLQGAIAPIMRGYVGKLSFYASFDMWFEYHPDTLFQESNYQPYNGVPYAIFGRREDRKDGGNLRSLELPRSGIGYDMGRLSLQAAIDYLRVGPAVHYPVTLSGTAPPITYVRMLIDFTHVEYYHVVGILRSQRNKSKYIYANGLRGSLWDGLLRWGVSEVMIGGSTTNQQDNDPENAIRPEYSGEEQGIEWAYVVPFVPMIVAENYAGDKTNRAFALDFSLNWPRDFRFYGEFFVDDMLDLLRIFDDDFGNKWAVTLGMQYYTNIYGRDVDAGIEYSRVEPWVYTHFYGGSHRYDHFNLPLGSPMGPNSMAVVAHGGVGLTNKISAGLKLTSLSNNPSTRGGKITDIFQFPDEPWREHPDSERKKFLGKGTLHYLRPGIYGRYDPLGFFRVNASLEVEAAQDKGRARIALDGGFRF